MVCDSCGKACSMRVVDNGYGWTSYGSNTAYHTTREVVSDCCEADVWHEDLMRVMTLNDFDAAMEEWDYA